MQQEMNTTQIVVRLGISARTVQRWIRSGKLKAKEYEAITASHDFRPLAS